MIRVLVVASSPIIRAGLEALLQEDPRFEIIPSVGAPAGRVRDIQADVLLMEVASTAPANTRALRHHNEAPTVLLTEHLRRAEIRRALQSGTRAILPRHATGSEIISAINAAALGLTVLSSETIDALLPAPLDDVPDFTVGEALSARELEVLAMMAEGLGNKDVAARLNISEHTVKFHVSSILGKLGATTRGEAVARGVRQGLIAI